TAKSGLPARRSVAETTGHWDKLEAGLAATYRFALQHGFSTRQADLAGWSAIAPAVEAVLGGRQSVEAALSEAQQAANAQAGTQAPARASATPFVVATPRPEPAAGEVKIEFAAHDWNALKEAYDELADAFHELHPEIHVAVKRPNYAQGYQTITLAWLAGQGDCFSYFYPLTDEPEPALLSLDPLLEADPAFSTDDFYPSILAPFYREGKLWALPAEAYPRVMYYNKDLFDAAGVASPAPGWTLDDFAQAAAQLSTGEGTARQYGYAPTPPWDDVWFFLGQQGVPLAADPDVPLADSNNAEAIRWYVDLRRAGITPEYELGEPGAYDDELYHRDHELWRALISRGKVAMWSGFPGEGDWWSAAPRDLNVAFVEMPHGPGQVAELHLSGYYISSQTEHPEACWEWIEFLSSQASTIQAIPARRAVARSDVYRQQMGEAADVYLAAVEGSQQVIDWAGFYWDSYQGRIVRAVVLARQGEDVEQALRQVQDQGEE
ncbi:MAG: sugar ABC transporter substrate-binding protein, partial [Planctomycetaceae bacterium]